MAKHEFGIDGGQIWASIKSKLREHGVNLEGTGCQAGDARVKVVCVAADLADTLQEVGQGLRDQVVMVRLDEDTTKMLDAWVETGSVRSRSEAAAVFIREGLNIRADELRQMKDALEDVERARQKLREKARQVFGGDKGEKP
jgi:Arc/MetJ-type ribon-helix-helix transcriptional regulator